MSLSPKGPTETITLTFDFSSLTSSIASASVSVSVFSGTDPNPAAILSGGPTISGSSVMQVVTGGISGVTYMLSVSATNASGSTYVINDTLLVAVTVAGTSLDELFQFVQPEITSCPNTVVRSAILRAAIEFCDKSLAYRASIPVNLVANQSLYAIPVPTADARLLQVTNVYFSNRELTPHDMDQIAMMLPNWQSSYGDPAYYNQSDMRTLRIFPIPAVVNVGDQFVVRAAFTPTRTASTLDNDLVNQYFEAMAAKTKSILMKMPKQPWTDQQTAMEYEQEFRTGCDDARINIMHDFTQGSMSVIPRTLK